MDENEQAAAIADSFIKMAWELGYFSVVMMVPFKDQGTPPIVALAYKSDDIWDAIRLVVDKYEEAEQKGRVLHVHSGGKAN
jgi:hypothetical protein